MQTPDEVLVYGPPGGVFLPDDYPWASTAIITAIGGAASDGTPGTTQSQAFQLWALPKRCRVICGEGGRDAYGRHGEPGAVFIELYR